MTENVESQPAGPLTPRTQVARRVLVTLGVVGPLAMLVYLGAPFGCSALNLLHLAWPEPLKVTLQLLALAVVLAGLAAIIYGFTKPRLRRISGLFVFLWVVSVPIVFIVLFLSVYGDPVPGTCVR